MIKVMRKPTPEVIPPAAKDTSPATTTNPIVGTAVKTGIEAETLAENGTEAAIKTVVTAEAVRETVVTAGAVVTVATGKETVQRGSRNDVENSFAEIVQRLLSNGYHAMTRVTTNVLVHVRWRHFQLGTAVN